MFEKEAKEYAHEHCCDSCKNLQARYRKVYQDGAEFGYNKAKGELEEKYKETICNLEMNLNSVTERLEELNKANEWHFVSKEGFPNKDDIYLIIRSDGLHLGDYCCGGDGDIDCQSWCDYPSEEEIQDDSVIAWKEIELPKENE